MTTEIGDNGVNTSSEEEKRVRDRLEESDEAEIEQKTRNVDKLFPTSLDPSSCDRRKRKSTDESPEVALKRTKYDAAESEEGDSPSAMGSSPSSSTSGVDLAYATEENEEELVKSSNDSLIKSLNNFKVFEYDECARSENSAIKGAGNVCETKKKKARPARSIKFTVVREFKFPRAQSYVTMPTNGGYSLGMEKRHVAGREVSLDRYRIERERSRRRKYRRWYQKLDVENDNSDSESENENEEILPKEGFCLMPVPLERRKQLLASSSSELSEKQRVENEQQFAEINLRSSRENCGCSCQNICYPESCECHINGIGCQVDRQYFPCGCLPKNCYNRFGRTSFNVDRVRAHLQRTLHRVNASAPFDDTPSIPVSDQEQHPYSFGDFTLPCGNPPLVNNFGNNLWNQCYSWSDYTSYEYCNSYNNGSSYHQMAPLQSQMEQYSVNQSLPSQNEPSEQLSESSESAFGDDNMFSPQPPQTDEAGFQTPTAGPLGLETSIQLPYQEDSNHSVPLSVGSE